MFRFFFSPITLFLILVLKITSVVNAKTLSFHMDYKETKSEFCSIKTPSPKGNSSQRKNVINNINSHPYTLFYNSIFKENRKENLTIAQLGILHDSSLLMWKNYFVNATLYGFEYKPELIKSFKRSYNTDRINLIPLNSRNPSNITEAFQSNELQYDLIINNTTYPFDDQIRVIKNCHPYLKPGGMLIIEGICKRHKEQNYMDRLQPILDQFQSYYFVTVDQKNKYSKLESNDKILVMVKAGANPIFKNKKKITIITPSIRPSNLLKIRNSIDFNYVDEWIIVYDGKKIPKNPHLFISENNPKIKEYIHTSKGISGNPQRNYALDHVQNKDTYLYFLDDDNLIHKDLYKLLEIIEDKKIYTFDQENRIKGNNIQYTKIDTAMFLIDFQLCNKTRWVLNEYSADFYYIKECYSKNTDKWIYVNNTLCTYNILSSSQ